MGSIEDVMVIKWSVISFLMTLDKNVEIMFVQIWSIILFSRVGIKVGIKILYIFIFHRKPTCRIYYLWTHVICKLFQDKLWIASAFESLSEVCGFAYCLLPKLRSCQKSVVLHIVYYLSLDLTRILWFCVLPIT